MPSSLAVKPAAHLEGCDAHEDVAVVEEVLQHVVDGRLGHDELLQVVRVELLAVHVDRRQEDGLHLVVPQLVRRLVRRDQRLRKSDDSTCSSSPHGRARSMSQEAVSLALLKRRNCYPSPHCLVEVQHHMHPVQNLFTAQKKTEKFDRRLERTCLALSATLAFSVLLSCVSCVRMDFKSSVRATSFSNRLSCKQGGVRW